MVVVVVGVGVSAAAAADVVRAPARRGGNKDQDCQMSNFLILVNKNTISKIKMQQRLSALKLFICL